jgi:hypothetical protein
MQHGEHSPALYLASCLVYLAGPGNKDSLISAVTDVTRDIFAIVSPCSLWSRTSTRQHNGLDAVSEAIVQRE